MQASSHTSRAVTVLETGIRVLVELCLLYKLMALALNNLLSLEKCHFVGTFHLGLCRLIEYPETGYNRNLRGKLEKNNTT